jgi:hypothetical protein
LDIKQIDDVPAAILVKKLNDLIAICETLGTRLKDFIARIYLVQFATLALASTAVVHFNLLKLKKKLDVIVRIQK